MKKTICIIGGDERNKKLGNILKEDFSVKIYDENFSNTKERYLYTFESASE